MVVARDAMFTCSDATQQEIAADIAEQHLDGMVVASCSPKLHTFTFRGVARRAGLNPYRYTQVNLREQCSWTHTDDPRGRHPQGDPPGARGHRPDPALRAAGADRGRTVPRALVIGGGVAGMRAAIGLADVGLGVSWSSASPSWAGWVAGLGAHLSPTARTGRAWSPGWLRRSRASRRSPSSPAPRWSPSRAPTATTRSRSAPSGEPVTYEVGQIIVTTGFDSYEPAAGEFGYGIPGVVTLPEFRRLLDGTEGRSDPRGPAGPHHRLHLLRRQPRRRARLLLPLLLQRRGACVRCWRPSGGRDPASITSTATCAPTAGTRLMLTESRAPGLALPEVRRRRAAHRSAATATACG